jgi:hypothetical protein
MTRVTRSTPAPPVLPREALLSTPIKGATPSQRSDMTASVTPTPVPPIPQEASPSTPKKAATPSNSKAATKQETTPSKSPTRGDNVLKTNCQCHLSFGTQQLLLKRILTSGGIDLVDNRLNSVICKGWEDLFGDHSKHLLQRLVYDKVSSWKNLDPVKLIALCTRFDLGPLLPCGENSRLFETTTTDTEKQQEQEPVVVLPSQEEESHPPEAAQLICPNPVATTSATDESTKKQYPPAAAQLVIRRTQVSPAEKSELLQKK